MRVIALFIGSLWLSVTMVAQEPAAPSPAASGSSIREQATEQGEYTDENRPLSGVQGQTLGESSEKLNIFTPSFTFAQGGETNPGYTAGQTTTDWSSLTTVGGALHLDRSSRTSITRLTYSGGGSFRSDTTIAPNTQYHSFDASQSWIAGRWTFLLGDTLSYSSNASIGLSPLLYPGSTNGGSDLPSTIPNDSILTNFADRVNNTANGQLSYGFTRRTSLTVNGSYGILRYLDGDFFDGKQFEVGSGVDHRFGHSMVGVKYTFGRFSYDNVAYEFDTNTVQVMYSKTLTGRLSLEVGGGPSFLKYRTLANISQVYGAGQLAVHYRERNSDLSLMWSRAVTGGSGVFAGAVTDSVTGSVSRKVSRAVTLNAYAGYARNAGTLDNSRFNTVSASGGASRQLGRYSSASLGYTIQKQTGSSNYPGLTRHAITISFNWGIRPIRLQ